MEKEFVPYELALKLQELGFDEPCLKMGMSDIDIINTERTDEGDYPKNSHLFSGWVTIPTFSEAFRWFREKHNLFGYVMDTKDKCFYWGVCKLFSGETEEDSSEGPYYNSFEEAELACLEKLIEIVESRSE